MRRHGRRARRQDSARSSRAPSPLKQREHRTGELRPALHVEDAERAPISQCGTRWWSRSERLSVGPAARRHVVLGPVTVGASRQTAGSGSSRRIDLGPLRRPHPPRRSAASRASPSSRLSGRQGLSAERVATLPCVGHLPRQVPLLWARRSSRRLEADRATSVVLEQAVDGFARARPRRPRAATTDSGCSRTSRISITVPPKVA